MSTAERLLRDDLRGFAGYASARSLAAQGEVPAFQFESEDVPMLLTLYAYDDLRGALRRRTPRDGQPGEARADRGNREAVASLLK